MDASRGSGRRATAAVQILATLLVGACGGSSVASPRTTASAEECETPAPERERARGPSAQPAEQVSLVQPVAATRWEDVPAPCPGITLSQCDAATACAKCRPALGFVQRLIDEGYDAREIAALANERFGPRRLPETTDQVPIRGVTTARVTLTEFSDFQCPHCGTFAPQLRRLVRDEFPGSVRLVFRHMPLSMHPRAAHAARAAVAAQQQDRFWEMHDVLFERAPDFSDGQLLAYAREIGLDATRFAQDLASDATRRVVERDVAFAERAGVDHTPMLFVNGHEFLEGHESLSVYIQEELAMTDESSPTAARQP